MFRFYLDNNIFQLIKSPHPSFNQSLLNLMNELKGKVLFCFSDAHLEDLKGSVKSYRDEDLLLMEQYVGDNYFSTDINQHFEIFLATPNEAYEGKNFSAVDDFFADPRSLDK